MDDYTLVLNAGSSSLKFCVFRRPKEEQWLLESRGQIEGIGTSPRLAVRDAGNKTIAEKKLETEVCDGRSAIDALACWLRAQYRGARVLAFGHRVVHGGARFTKPTILTKQILADLYELVPLAPLHQPYNLAAIGAVFERLPDVPQVACFDTSFHAGRAQVTEVVPLPSEICGINMRRYGFHGLSYEYVASKLEEVAPEIAGARVIIAHLGSGASLCALNSGKSVDTSMGFTALDGLCMGTRPGHLDPGAVLYLFQSLKLTVKEVETILYKKSGLLGISGYSNDMRDLLANDSPPARLALDYFIYSIAKEIGALAAVLRGIDGLVFTAGIGENSPEIRLRICEACSWLGVEVDSVANSCGGPRISSSKSRVSTWIIPTNEELIIARHTGSLLGLLEPVPTT